MGCHGVMSSSSSVHCTSPISPEIVISNFQMLACTTWTRFLAKALTADRLLFHMSLSQIMWLPSYQLLLGHGFDCKCSWRCSLIILDLRLQTRQLSYELPCSRASISHSRCSSCLEGFHPYFIKSYPIGMSTEQSQTRLSVLRWTSAEDFSRPRQ